ncbi:MAG: histidinol phosphatase [Chitinivibrionales bacterium]|nr:histidinol phosphatase [Chitinivibrionales bacterium]MBD3396801.1 histidinol phosphatase [Chitinivibrionales bacterium]
MGVVAFEQELQQARAAAQRAGALQEERRERLDAVEHKQDDSPVTEVDRACEALIRDALLAAFPSDGFLGEETGAHTGHSGRTWIVDPLDGTRPYVRGIPTYSALIALEDGDGPALGIMHLPAMRQTYWAARGGGAFLNGAPIHVSATGTLSRAMGSALGHIQKADTAAGRSLARVMGAWDYAYGFMDAYSYGCVAAGRLDVCVNLLDKAWDCAAAACIVREAGGRYTDIRGHANIYHGSIVLSNGRLHDEVLSFFHDSTDER